MNETLDNYISVSEAAEYLGKTTSHVYNMIRDNSIHAIKFNRGTMAGWLVEKPCGFDTWKQQQSDGK